MARAEAVERLIARAGRALHWGLADLHGLTERDLVRYLMAA